MTDLPESVNLPNRTLLAAYRQGDQAAATVLFNRYLVRLTALARSRLSRRLARRIDPEDVVLSAYRSFFVAAADGRLAAPAHDDLWPLLVVLVLRKISKSAEQHTAARRDVNREAVLGSALLSEAIGRDATPEQAAILDEELAGLLGQLSPRDREIVSLRLQGETEPHIATVVRCSDRTVRRALERMRGLIVESGGIGSVVWPARTIMARNESRVHDAADVARAAVHDWPTIDFTDLRLLNLIGSGGFAKLYRARRHSDSTIVAVKFLRKRFWKNPQAVAGLLNEAQVLRTLRHPQIVTLLGSGHSTEGAPFLVLPWIDGEDFDAWRNRTHPTVEQIVDAMLPVMDAAGTAHAAGIVHCDLKPSNLLRDKDGRTYLTDFGFAQPVVTGSFAPLKGGTLGFLAPEQCSEAFGAIDPRTDIYGLGATLYAMLCARPPFVGRDAPEILAQIVSSQAPQPPSHWNSAVPAWLDAGVLRCLHKEPGERLQSVAELMSAVHERIGNTGKERT